MLSTFTWFIIIFILLLISTCFIPEEYPPCFKSVESEKSSGSNPCCPGDACAFKFDCQKYKNHINDN